MIVPYVAVGILAVTLVSCGREVDITADYKDVPGVYCLLDRNEQTQYLRLQKAYLMDGDATLGMHIKDSMVYNPSDIDIKLFSLGENGTTGAGMSFVYHPEITTMPGNFPQDAAMIYTLQASLPEFRYRLQIINKKLGKEYYAETEMVNSMMWNNLYENQEVEFTENEKPRIEWQTHPSAFIYQPSATLYWDERDLVTETVTSDSLVWYLPMHTPMSTEKFMSVLLVNQSFIAWIRDNTPPKQNVRRKIKKVCFSIYGGSKDLWIYTYVNTPSIGIVQNLPKYTNLEGGFGIFASRERHKVNIRLSEKTREAILGLGYGYEF